MLCWMPLILIQVYVYWKLNEKYYYLLFITDYTQFWKV